MKRIISLVLALSMVLSICASALAATTYPDLVGENAKYAAAVDALTELKVINGFPDGEFKPGNELTRAELAKMLVICLGLGDQVSALSAKTVFSDVATSHWAAGYINAAAQAKIINGYPDGEFKPEKNVTYAEAFTMVLRALGYGNVVDAEGTWPTAYMLKAVELSLTDDMENVTASANATRGNTAILLWNMLRTNMWRIDSENETNGMNKRNTGETMLSVKFPDYDYVKTIGNLKATLAGITITDNEEVKAELAFDGDIIYEGTIKDVDFAKLLVGMEVEALVRDWKKPEKTAILTLTPVNTIVAGFVTDLTEIVKGGYYTFKVNGTEYRFSEDFVPEDLVADDSYIVFEANGKKVVNDRYDLLTVSETTYLEAQSQIDGMIEEDDLVIIDGVWGKQADVKEGSIVTEVAEGERPGFAGYYFEVVSASKEVNFDIMFVEKEDWLDAKEEVEYVTLGNEDFRTDEAFSAWENDKNSKEIGNGDYENTLQVKYKDNEYSDTKVEAFFNYLGMVARLHFGDADKNSSNAGFYVVTSNGAWGEGSNKGVTLNLELVGQDGKEDTYKTIVSPNLPNDDGRLEENKGIYEEEEPTFVWVDFDDDDKNIETVIILEDGIPGYEAGMGKEYDDAHADYEGYRSKFAIADASNVVIDGKKLIKDGEELDARLGGTTYFYEATMVKNDKGNVIGVEVEVSTDKSEYDGYELPEGSLIAVYEDKVRYVFIPGEANSNMLWGRLGPISISKETVKIDTSSATKLGTDDDTIEEDDNVVEGAIVGYRESKDGKTAKIFAVQPIEDINDPDIGIVDGKAEVEDDDDFIPLLSGDKFDTDSSDSEVKADKKVPVYKVTLQKKNDKVKVVSVRKVGEGRSAIQENIRGWDRIVSHKDKNGKVDAYFIFTGIFDSKNVDEEFDVVPAFEATEDDDDDLDDDGSDLDNDGSDLDNDGSDLNNDGSDLNNDGSDLNNDGSDLNNDGSDLNNDGSDLTSDPS